MSEKTRDNPGNFGILGRYGNLKVCSSLFLLLCLFYWQPSMTILLCCFCANNITIFFFSPTHLQLFFILQFNNNGAAAFLCLSVLICYSGLPSPTLVMRVRTCVRTCVPAYVHVHVLVCMRCLSCTCWYKGKVFVFLFYFHDSMIWQSGGEKCYPASVRVLSTKILHWVTVIGFHASE